MSFAAQNICNVCGINVVKQIWKNPEKGFTGLDFDALAMAMLELSLLPIATLESIQLKEACIEKYQILDSHVQKAMQKEKGCEIFYAVKSSIWSESKYTRQFSDTGTCIQLSISDPFSILTIVYNINFC